MQEKITITTDAEWVALLDEKESKEQLFKNIIDTYKQRLYAHIRRMVVVHADADDVLQETFIKAWRHMDNFRQDSSMYTWLYKIATNCSLTHLSKRQLQNKRTSTTDVNNLSEQIQQENTFDANKLEWKLQLAIQTLPEKQRVVFNLRYYDEMPYQKMSEILETSEGALKASYHIAAKKVSEYILNH